MLRGILGAQTIAQTLCPGDPRAALPGGSSSAAAPRGCARTLAFEGLGLRVWGLT